VRSGALYQIIDEPKPGVLGRLVSQPFVPLLSFMFVGAFLSWPWFVFNAFALGSHRRWRDLAWAVAGFLGRAALAVGLVAVFQSLQIDRRYLGLGRLVPIMWSLLVSYRLYLSQQDPAELYELYHAPLGSRGLLLVVAAAIAVPALGWYSNPYFLIFLR